MRTIVFFLEEPSAKELLKGILPRILPDDTYPRYVPFQGKQDLEKNLISKIRGWNTPDTVFVVMRDQDMGDCFIIKNNLKALCDKANKGYVLIRIVCRELESFYLGDLQAVETGMGIPGLTELKKYKKPDSIANPSRELFRITKKKYQKIAGSRAISPHLNLEGNGSHSFNVLVSGIKRLLENK